MEIKPKAIVPITAGEDLTAAEGRFVKLSNGKAVSIAAATDSPFGVVIEGAAANEMAGVAVCGGNAGTLHIVAAGNITKGSYCQMTAAGKIIADSGTGARIICAIALEAGTEDQLIEAVLLTPITHAA